MCCIKKCCKLGCKCIKWILILLAILIVIALVVIIVVVALALSGTETLQKIVEMSFSCMSGGECPESPGIFYKVMTPYIDTSTYEWGCTFGTRGDQILMVGWHVKFDMGEKQSLGVTLKEYGSHSTGDYLKIYFNFVDPYDENMVIAECDAFALKESTLIKPTELDLTFEGEIDFGSDRGDEKILCLDEYECDGRLQRIDAHFLLKFERVPEFLCLRWDEENIGALDFLTGLAKTIGKVWKEAETEILSWAVMHMRFPIDTVEWNDAPLNEDAAKTCVFSQSYESVDSSSQA